MKSKYGLPVVCSHCGEMFLTKPRFLEYCSTPCKNPINRKGNIPWNKGREMTAEQKAKLNIEGLKKGRGWNKGLPNEKQREKWTGSNNPNWEGKLNNLRPKKIVNDEFVKYKRECKKQTHRTRYAMKREGLIPDNIGKRKDQYQLDHIIPFKQGYELGIDPKIIGGKSNLQWILGEENRTKWDRFQPEEIINKVLGEYNGLQRPRN
jgi:hypothetical protein